jgi:hypothetical protein
MLLKKNLFYLFFCFIVNSSAFPQPYIKGIIIERSTRLPIAFASVTYRKESFLGGVISDIHGEFKIYDKEIKSISVSCVGYERKTILITPGNSLLNMIIELKTDTLNIAEVIITPASNPAIPIIKKVLENKEKNNYEYYEKYRYQCYFKTLFNLKLSYSTASQDSTNAEKNKIDDKRARFISESVVSCSRSNNRTDNKIIAVRTSGFDNPLLGQYFFTAFHNAISFYNNNISLFAIPVSEDMTNEEYLSPLSSDCLKSYNFHLEETYENLTDTLYLIEFHPKKDKHFNSLKGKLYISSNGYAIKNIVTEPYEKGLIDFKFRQDYVYLNNRWFPSTLDEEIGFVSVHVNRKINAYPVYLITSKINDVDFNPVMSGDSIKYEHVYLDQASVRNSDSILRHARTDSLSVTDRNTYQYMDSVGRRYRFDYWAEIYPNILVGKVPVKIIDVDLVKLYTENLYEGTRISLGINTNEKFLKHVSFGGFAGYGIKDEKFKYGGYLAFNIDKYREMQLKLSYQNNLKEPGSDLNEDFTLLSLSDYFRSYLASRMDNFIEEKAEINVRLFRYLKLAAALNIREIRPTYDYQYKGSLLPDYHADEIQITARYAYGEELATFGNRRIVNYRGNPVINITYKRGFNLFHEQSCIYDRIEASIDISAYRGRFGQSDIRLAGGYIDKSVPYGLLFTGEGSKGQIPLVINNTFQTVSPYEFLSDEYLDLFYTHNFGSLLFEKPKFKPKFIIAQNIGWGLLKNASDHSGIDFKEKDKIFLESGLLINNLLSFKIFNLYHLGFGGGAFYRYGHYSYDKIIDNFAFKMSVSLSLK